LANRRAELWNNMKTALQGGHFSIPDSDSLHADLTSVGFKYDSQGRLLLEAKADMKKRGMPSPDEADAVALFGAGWIAPSDKVIEYWSAIAPESRAGRAAFSTGPPRSECGRWHRAAE
jgi:hypothetical protein